MSLRNQWAECLPECRESQSAHEVDEALFRAMFADAGIGIALLDLAGTPLRCNPALQKMLGYDEARLGNAPFLDISNSPLNEDERALLGQLLAGQCHHFSYDKNYTHRDGMSIWARVTLSAVRGERAAPCYLVAMVVDITEQRRSERALRTAEEKYRAIFENAVEGIFQSSPDGRYLSANPTLATMYGYESAEHMIATLTDIGGQLYVDPTRRDEFMRLMQQQDEVRHFISQVHRQDGSMIWICENTRAVRDSFGRLRFYEGIVEDITERKHAEQQLLHDALHDGLTGLPNRALLLDRLAQAMARQHRREDYGFAVLFIDCDNFKLINDSLGHLIGDQLLIDVARRIGAIVRREDTLARMGGDEFVILVEELKIAEEVRNLADRIHAKLRQPFTLKGQEVFISASIGIVIGSSAYQHAAELLRDADTAMYEAKANGRGTSLTFETGMHLQAVSLLRVESDLRRALERNEFRLYYQPIIALATGAIAGFEALIRWQHPERGMVPPDTFISIAEDTGLINPIGDWVLETGCRQMMRWRDRLGAAAAPLTLSVNLSPTQLRQAHVVPGQLAIIRATGFDPRLLRLEITETAIMDNPLAAKAKLEALKAQGIQIYIDDFGTGYSSLSHLHRFPLDALKIDRSFIGRMEGGENVEMVRTIAMLGNNLGLSVIAEGIETQEQWDLLRAMGCPYGQGYLFSKPVDADAAEAFILAQPSLRRHI